MRAAVIVTLVLLGLFGISQASGINFYSEPSAKAKVVHHTEESSSLVTIFHDPKYPAWLKVADTNNGTVGWIPAREFVARTPHGTQPNTHQADSTHKHLIKTKKIASTSKETNSESDFLNEMHKREQEVQANIKQSLESTNKRKYE